MAVLTRRPLVRAMRRLATALPLGGLLGCGGATAANPVYDASADAARPHPSGADASLAFDADAAPSPDARSEDGDAGASCDDLEDAAAAGLVTILGQNLGCQVDEDCISVGVGSAGWCAAPCPVLTNEAGAAVAVQAAADLCARFNAQSCQPPLLPCVSSGPIICGGGTCAHYEIGAQLLSSDLAHGVCATFAAEYRAYAPVSVSPDVPHDIDVSVTASNGTLYTDTDCTSPTTAPDLTIPKGASRAVFGFVPATSGRFWITLDGVVASFDAN
jgi:hypothetical protein